MVDGRTRTGKIVNHLKGNNSKPIRDFGENKTPIATDMYMPNHSGVSSHPEFKSGGDDRWVNLTGDTMTGALNLDISSALTTSNVTGQTINAISTGNMADGFGPRLDFGIGDDTASKADIGAIRVVRDGGDTTGKMQFLLANAGVPLVKATISPNGDSDWQGTLTANALICQGDLTVDTDTLFVDSGNNKVGIGTTAPAFDLTVVNLSQAIVNPITYSAGGSASAIVFDKSKGTTAGSHVIVEDGDRIGEIFFRGSDGTTFDIGASIRADVDGTPGPNTDMPMRLVFGTSPAGSTVTVDHMDITSAGLVGITTDSPVTNLDVNGGFALNLVAKTANYTATTSDHTITCGAGNESFTISLPAAGPVTGIIFEIKNVGTGTITVDPDGTETIDGATTQVINTQYDSLNIQSHNGTWWII